jgi:polysaccharide export outer membrane protein
LMIVVWDRPDLNNPYGNVLGASNAQIGHLVDTKGYIYFPYAGNIYVAGLTISELHDKLTENLTAYIKNPQVEVKILDYRGQLVSVQGAVKITGYHSIEDVKNTLGQMIAAAGGYADKANLSQALLIRGEQTHVIDLLETYEDGTNGFNIRVKDKDTIKINYQSESNVYAFGAVSKPGAIELGPHRINLRDAMATMNVTVGADLKQIYVLRRQDNTRVTIYHLDASSPVSLVMAGDFILRSNDIVYVQYNGSDQWASVMAFLAPFLGTASTLKTTIYNTENLFQTNKQPYRP